MARHKPKPRNAWGFIKEPIAKDGPELYAKIVSCFIDGLPKTKKQIFQEMSIVETDDGYSATFAELSKSNVIVYETKLNLWKRGENYFTMLSYVLQHFTKNMSLATRFKRVFKEYGSNSISLIDSFE